MSWPPLGRLARRLWFKRCGRGPEMIRQSEEQSL